MTTTQRDCPAPSTTPKQRRRRRSGVPLAEIEAALIPDADRRAIKSVIAEMGQSHKKALPQGQVGNGGIREVVARAMIATGRRR